jgi:N-acetylneuraminate synthase/N,N'-diacetyllegionaminate synthase
MPSEEENAHLVRRSWHAARDLAAGATLGSADLALLRPEGGVSPAVDLRGRTLARQLAAGQPITPDDLVEAS